MFEDLTSTNHRASWRLRRCFGVCGDCLRTVLLCGLLALSVAGVAQKDVGPETELRQKAQAHFDQGEYAQSMQLYSQLLSLHPASPDYNYHYGASLVFGDADKEKSFKHLRFAIGKENVPDEVHYYLGKAYHLNYQFNDALEQYRTYTSISAGRKKGKIDVELATKQCQNGLNLLSNIKDVDVLRRVETSQSEFFRNYDLSDVGGRILVCPEELLSKYDLKTGERFLMYFPGTSSTVFFSSYGKDGSNGLDIFRAVRLPNGSWSRPIAMTGINTPYNDNFPFLHPDGETFYFASEGHNSMGGYDLFKCKYNELSDTFSSPENLDFAVNSPDDDLLYVTDKRNERAYFASSRSSGQGRLHVYQVRVSVNPLQLVLLKGNFIPEKAGVGKFARISVTDAGTNSLVGEYVTNPETGDYVIDLPRSGQYRFTVDAEGSKLAHNGIVEVPAHDEVVAFAQEITLVEAAGTEKLIIRNSFDQPLSEDIYALAQRVLKNRAGLEVNDDGNEEPVVSASKSEGNLAGAYQEAGFAIGRSNESILESALQRQAEIGRRAREIRKESEYAYTMAELKREQAAKAARDAEDFLRLADAVGEEEVSSKYLMQAMASKFAAEKLSEEAVVAVRLAGQLDVRLAEVEQEEQQAMLLAEDLEKALASNDYQEAVIALRAVKESEEKGSGITAHQADEHQLLRELARERSKASEVATNMAKDLREEENSLQLRIKNRKLQLESAKNKDKPDIQQEVDILENDLEEVQKQIETVFADLETSQLDADRLVEQANLYRKIHDNQSDTYIAEDQLQSYNPDKGVELEQKASSLKAEVESMEFNMAVVRDIIESETNVAFEAFANESEFNAFVQRYDLPHPPETVQTQTEEESPEEIRDRIAAARDWIDIIDESVAELEAERKSLPAGEERDAVDQKLADFQQLKYKRVEEIETAQEALSVADAREADAVTPITERPPEPVDQITLAGRQDRSSLTGVQTDPRITEIYPTYTDDLAALENQNLNNEEGIRQKTNLDKKLIAALDSAIAVLDDKPESVLTQDEVNDLEILRIYKRQTAEEIAFNENYLAQQNGASPRERTSTEILLEASGGASDQQLPAGEDETPVDIAEARAESIPESVSYTDIQPEYEQQLAEIRASNDSEIIRREQENRLHREFISNVDVEIERLEAIAENAVNSENQLRAEKAIGQLNQIRQLKESEVVSNQEEIQELKTAEFANEYAIITREVDEDYVVAFFAIEESDDSDYFKAINKARLEQEVVEQIDTRMDELVGQMDEATELEEQQELQETIQELQQVRQEKVIAYESLFAQAEMLAVEKTSSETTENIVAEEASTEDRSTETTPSQETRDEATETASEEFEEKTDAEELTSSQVQQPEEDVDQPYEVEEPVQTMSHESLIGEFVDNATFDLGNLGQYTVFGEVNNMNYKSLNASLDMEAIGGDLNRHRERVVDFVSDYANTPLDEEGKALLEEILSNELSLQERISGSNRREFEYYETGNADLLDEVFAAPPKKLSEESRAAARDAITEARQLRNDAVALRNQARSGGTPSQRLRWQQQAYEKEVLAIEKMGKANRALTFWKQGKPRQWDDPSLEGVPVAVRTQPIAELVATERELQVIEQPVVSEPSSEETDSAFEPQPESAETVSVEPRGKVLSESAVAHFNLSEEQLQRIESRPVYSQWFDQQWKADSLEILRTQRFTQAEAHLNEAEELLLRSEEFTVRADNETDEAAKEDAYNRSLELQNEARDLFELARQLREEMAQYSAEAKSARDQADALLNEVAPDEAAELSVFVADRPAEQSIPSVPEQTVDESATTGSDERPNTTAEQTTTPVEPANTPESESLPLETQQEEATVPAERLATESLLEEESNEPTPVPAFPEMEFVADIEEIFETDLDAAYSVNNPIPVGVEWPDGLVFAVQVGAFRNPIPQDHFRGFAPIRGEVVRDGITRYSAGLFTAFDRANSAKNEIRGKGYSDAFVVAYLNGERIALNRALTEADAAAIIADAAEPDRATVPSVQSTTQPVTSAAADTPVEVQTTPTLQKEFVPDPSATAYYNDPDAAPAVQVERIRGLFFTVQVGVFSRPVSAAALNNITPLNSEQTANGYIRYTSGMFPDLDFAQGHRQVVINAGVSDAFVTAYYNGERIAVAQARALMEERGEEVLAGSPQQEESPVAVVEEDENPVAEQPASATSPRVVNEESNASLYADASDFEPEDIRYVVDLGSYGSGMPQQTADAILQMPDAGVARLPLPDGNMHYLSKPMLSYTEAEVLRLQFFEAGVEDAEVKAMALGFLLKLDDARRMTGE